MFKKFTGPGLLRLFLALLVFVHHVTRFAVGSCAVYVFFCLSGFWIYRMWTGRYSRTRHAYLTYLVSRAWRLFPTFWLVTAITLGYDWYRGFPPTYLAKPGQIHFAVSNLLILGYHSLGIPPLVPAWSLDAEMQFYLVAPLIALLLARRRIPAGAVLVSALVLSLGFLFLSGPTFFAKYLIYFVIGMTAAALDWRPSGKLVLVSLGTMTLVVACCLLSPWRGILLVGAHPGQLAIYTPHANVALALFVMPYAIYTTRQTGFSHDVMFADLSYIVYLLHWPATVWIDAHPGDTLHRVATIGLSFTAVMVTSFVIWKFYDRSINRMRSRWVNSRKKANAGGTSTAPQIQPTAVAP